MVYTHHNPLTGHLIMTGVVKFYQERPKEGLLIGGRVIICVLVVGKSGTR